ncbi:MULTISPECIES: ATP-binding protein [unclassified Rhodanobacter]|uniref:ATP-binding protein n=1 Tax=unclassified Rhodanobacter TaxID=2621553 RepID=UPI000A8FFBC9|nr:ATP-binding protein [Rhodanobacter sp. FW510-R10]
MTHTIRLQADERALFQNLREAFSPASVYGELLQNARRAGATLIEVTFDGETLSVADNGHGIEDLQQLLLKATSEWTADVIEEDRPFGLGFLAAVYACDSIRVATRTANNSGQGFIAMTEHVLAGDVVAVVPVTREEAGTTVTLYGFKTQGVDPANREYQSARVANLLANAARGFPVPVAFNGTLLPRPHAVDDSFITTSIGKVRLSLSDALGTIYVQGLPVEADRHRGSMTVIHADRSFRARLPDRLHLVDAAGARRRIKEGLTEAAQETLRRIKATMEPRVFLKLHAVHCATWNCKELLDDVPFALGEWFVDWQQRRPGWTTCEDERPVLDGVLSQEEILARGVVLLPDEDGAVAQAWTAASDRFTWETTAYVSQNHWLMKTATDVQDDDTFQVEIDGEGRSQLVELTDYLVRCSAVERICITHVATGEAHDVDMLVLADPQESWRKVIHVTKPGAILQGIRLLSSFTDGSDVWQDSEEDADVAKLEAAYAELVATSPEHLLEMRLKRANELTDQSPRFAGRSFIVCFDENGALQGIKAAA